MSTLAAELARWAAATRYEDLPADVIAATRLRVLDFIGVCLAAVPSPLGQALRRTAEAAPGGTLRPAFTPTGARSSPELDAFVNGTLASALDFDDTHIETVIHPTSAAAGAVLGVAERRPLSGRAVLAAIAVGSEICCRVGIGAPGLFHVRGFHPTGIIGALGGAGAASHALGLDAGGITAALGLAASFGAGIMQSWADGTDARFIHSGNAAMAGLISASLAAAGVTGPSGIVEGRHGLLRTHIQGDVALPLERVTRGLGRDWETRRVAYKPYPTGHVTHSFIDAMLELVREGAVPAEEITGINCPIADYMVGIVCEPAADRRAPRSASAARVSLQHIMAEAAVYGEIGARSFAPERLDDPRVRRIAAATSYTIDENAPPRGRYKGWVQVRLRDGSLVERVAQANWGSPEKPMTEADVIAKFEINAAALIAPERRARIVEIVRGLERLDDVAELVALLAPAAG